MDDRDPAGPGADGSIKPAEIPATGVPPEKLEFEGPLQGSTPPPPEARPPARAVDAVPGREDFLRDALTGLQKSPREIPGKYLYDGPGWELFEQIRALPEYYLARKELDILHRHGDEIAAVVGPHCEIIEYGSGNAATTRLLLSRLRAPLTCYLIDLCGEQLFRTCDALRAACPGLRIQPVCTDYTEPVDLPDPPMVRGQWEAAGILRTARRLAFVPGSAIGNFTPDEAVGFMRQIGKTVGAGGIFLAGVDLKKDASVLEAAYDDAAGLSARFNLNLLARMNRELGADFDLAAFRHCAFFNPVQSRIEMHLVSLSDQAVHLAGQTIPLARGETIRTQCSYKYTLLGFSALAARAGFHVERVWMDDDNHFSVQILVQEG